jgi:predicted metal-dependent hydrolase
VHDITVRRMAFDFPDEIDPIFIPGEPEESYGIIGLSLLLPHLEPYLIRTMKVAKQQIRDPDLLVDLERFSAQEGQHYREHMRFNAALRLERFPGLAALEDELSQDYQRFTRERSLRFNLAYAEGFEALTTAFARFSFEERGLGDMDSPAADLIAWHTIEELEHRTVAFDVYDHLIGGYFYRLFHGLFAQWHLIRFVRRVSRSMLEADPEAVRRAGDPVERRARTRALLRLALRKLLPNVLRTYLPWYTPHRIELTPEMQRVARRYTERAKAVLAGPS